MAKKDKALYIPPVLSLVVSTLFVVAAIVMVITGAAIGGDQGIPGAYVGLAIILIFFAYLAGAIFSGTLSWMVLETVQGKKTSVGRGLGRAFSKTGSLLIYALVSLVVALLAAELRKDARQQNFIVSIIKGMFASMLQKAWDIASHLALPAIILTKNSFAGAMKEMPEMVKHLPQVLVGGFAFDFVVRWVYLIEVIFGVLMIFLIPYPVGLILGIGFILLAITVTYIFYSFVKDVYFTMLYIDLHPALKKKA